jgi:F-type H+-transporting ATPase subunit delta
VHDIRVAKRYALALFETAVEAKIVGAVEDDLGGIVSLLVNNPQFRRVLLSPEVSRDEKMSLVDKLFSDRITALSMQALRLMLEKGREQEIEWVQRDFVRLRREHENKLFVVVTTSELLDDDQRSRMIAKLESITGKQIEAEYRIDPHLIGGVRVA